MTFDFIILSVFSLFGILALLTNGRGEHLPSRLGFCGCLLGGLLGMAGVIQDFVISGSMNFSVYGRYFALLVLLLGIGGGLHALGYLHGEIENRHGYFWFFYDLMIASMVGVTMASNLLVFVIFWELMGLFSFALVAFEYHENSVFKAAWTYLLACEAGGLLLVWLLGNAMQVAPWSLLAVVMAIIAFGLKAGLPGLHVWLPEAHPAAPAPVSAVMSGAMIPLGFLGLIQVMGMWSPEDFHYAKWIFLICGIVVMPYAMLLGAGQNNLKRLLAYSSVENMGVVTVGIGLWLLGRDLGNPLMQIAALAGSVVHIYNHGMLKGTLFLGAGNILRGTGTLSIDALGGLWKAMPATSRWFTLSAFSLCGLPPFNGFIGEFLIYTAAFTGIVSCKSLLVIIICSLVIFALAVTGGLAAAVYAKAVGGCFLGEPRADAAIQAHEARPVMLYAMKILTLGSLILFLAAPWFVRKVAGTVLGTAVDNGLIGDFGVSWVCAGSLLVAVVVLLLLYWRNHLIRGRQVEIKPTWDCGYARPTARMEYTGTALVQPVLDYFAGLLQLKRRGQKADGLFPETASVNLQLQDRADSGLWKPLYKASWHLSDIIHRLQSGSLHLYILIMIVALMAMLIWGLCLQPEVTNEF